MGRHALKASGILQIQNLGLIEAVSAPEPERFAALLFEIAYENGINVQLAAEVHGPDSRHRLTICVDADDIDRLVALWEAGGDRLHLESCTVRPSVTILAIYGPHFREKPGAASIAYSAFCAAGVPVLAVSTSFSAVAFVLDKRDVERGLESLLLAFGLGRNAVLISSEGCSRRT